MPLIFAAPPHEPTFIVPQKPSFRVVGPTNSCWPRHLSFAIVAAVALLAPIPLASNRPLAWMLWAVILGLAATILSMAPRLAPLPVSARHLLVIGVLFIVFTLFQATPLPVWQGNIRIDTPAGAAELRSLSLAPSATFLASLRLSSYLVFFFLALQVAASPRLAKKLGQLLFLGTITQAAYAVAALELLGDVALFGPKQAYPGTATGTFVNRNSLATFLGMGFVLGLSLLRHRPARRSLEHRIAHGLGLVGLLLIATALILTQSRMGLVSAAIGTGTFFLLAGTGGRTMIAFVAIALAVAAAFWHFGLLYRLDGLEQSALTRSQLYTQVLDMIRNQSLTGFGLDSFPLAFQLFHAPPVTAAFVWDKAHSTYLTLWAETGVAFGSLPILAGILAARALWSRARQKKPGQSMALAGFAALGIGAIHSLADFSLEIQANAFFLLALIALGLGASDKGTS